MSSWPKIMGEDATLDAAISGVSLARFGDGELNLIMGGKCVTQMHSIEISAALSNVLKEHVPGLLVCLPTMYGPKAKFWSRYDQPAFHKMFKADHYGSAFVTRPDSAPNINKMFYWHRLRQLWAGKHVTLVRGSGKSLTADMLYDAASVHEVIVPKRNAFEQYENIVSQIGLPRRCLLCCGPTATILAHDLAKNGVHAIDLGHIGMFLRKHLEGKPMVVTDEDKKVDAMA